MINDYLLHELIKTCDAPVPAKGVSEGFAERNRRHGSSWSQLDDDEKLVFSKTYFFALANVERLDEDDDDAEEVDEEPEDIFDEAKFEQLKPIYARLVDDEKVRDDFGDLSGGHPKVQSKKALKMIKNITSDVSLHFLDYIYGFPDI